MSPAAAVVATITATSMLVTAAAEVCTQDTYTVAKGSAAMYAQYVHRGEGVKVFLGILSPKKCFISHRLKLMNGNGEETLKNVKYNHITIAIDIK